MSQLNELNKANGMSQLNEMNKSEKQDKSGKAGKAGKAGKPGKFRFGLTAKICMDIVLICLLVSGLVSLVNYFKCRESIYELHIDYDCGLSGVIEEELTDAQWQALADEVDDFQDYKVDEKEMERFVSSGVYKSARKHIQTLLDNVGLSEVRVFMIDRQEMDSTTEENYDAQEPPLVYFLMDFAPENDDDEPYESGYASYWWGDYEDFAYYRGAIETVLDSKSYTTMREKMENGGARLTTYYPVMNGDNVIAVLQISNDDLQIMDFMQEYVLATLFRAVVLSLILIILALTYSYVHLIHPLQLLRQEAEKFVKNKAELSTQLDQIQTHDEIEDLAQSFMKMEKEVQDYIKKVADMTEESARISTELQVATKIQEGMLPSTFPAFPERDDFQIYATMDPAKEVGGDFYDFFLLDENHLAIVIADVSGKGVPAALFMAITKSLLKNRAKTGGSLSEILYDVNNQICEGNEEGMFVTVWMAIIDLRTGEGTAVNAGHEHPVRSSKENGYELVCYRHSMAMAAFDGASFAQHEFKLEAGDRIFVYTDGLPEAINSHEEAYGTQRFIKILNQNADASLEDLLDMIAKDVEDFKGEEAQFDDLTMLMFEYKGQKV